jgi:hypothetical protein
MVCLDNSVLCLSHCSNGPFRCYSRATIHTINPPDDPLRFQSINFGIRRSYLASHTDVAMGSGQRRAWKRQPRNIPLNTQPPDSGVHFLSQMLLLWLHAKHKVRDKWLVIKYLLLRGFEAVVLSSTRFDSRGSAGSAFRRRKGLSFCFVLLRKLKH